MASNVDLADRFDVSGPTHIMSRSGAGRSSPMMIDWNNEEDRRCVAACVVKGTYILENDRTMCRVHAEALAPPWWESFHFRLSAVLTEESFRRKCDKLIFGAIYEHVPVAGGRRNPCAPQYIVAFRGTMLPHPKAIHDLFLDFKIMANTLSDSKRSELAHRAVDTLLATIARGKAGSEGSGVVWLAGHSLGASLALEVGRTMMAEQGRSLPTFLFNPPHVSTIPAINVMLPSEGVRRELLAKSNLVKAGLGLVLSPHRKRMERLFERLSPWAPNLYVHERDVICQGFIGYFEQRQQLEERCRGAKSATTLSYRDMLFSALGKEKERPHLLPSATLWKNSSMDRNANLVQQSLAAHELQQWWKPDADLRLSDRRYSFA
ncbi:GDSL esterase/lipase At4g10955-like [Triticum dicoccoides]|uniref:GDSL esterase/lipase At4g10955-like n=1 Tax=Triticum dicoccoides TaxID=85692 RepID=UPI0003D497A9|nr:GDSL esterase/lipase At4g10955-like [Triticum dicoccoides]